ncbi:MAG: hypothetical protein ACKO0M_01840 [Cyanobium sp.]
MNEPLAPESAAGQCSAPAGRIGQARPYLWMLLLSLGAHGWVNVGLQGRGDGAAPLIWGVYAATWLLLALCSIAALTHHRRAMGREQTLLSALLSLSLMIDLVEVNVRLVQSRVMGQMLLLQGVLLFVALLALFTWLYWRLDGPGEQRCFWWIPPPRLQSVQPAGDWQPGFIDYLYLSSTVSFSFFPCVDPIRPLARILVIVQLVVVFDLDLILLARAVSLIPT